jgi:hypothetical protein
MSDITKCSGQGCPIKEKCFRFTASKNEYGQSYFIGTPGEWNKTDDSDEPYWICQMFWGEQNESILNQLKEIMK